jgi:hypothetical protein
MSLAFNASPFNSDTDYVDIKNGDTPITRKKQTNNRTQKRPPSNSNSPSAANGNTDKVNALLSSIHNSSPADSEMGDFNPPSPPQSSGVQNTIMKEHQQQQQQQRDDATATQSNQSSDDEVNMDHLSDKSYAEDYYRKMIPNYGNGNQGRNRTNNMFSQQPVQDYYRQQSYTPSYEGAPYIRPPSNNGRDGDMMEKLNYMINLLEESQDERTGSVTEEVILYSFLGIFIIFIADSFARVGKYTR